MTHCLLRGSMVGPAVWALLLGYGSTLAKEEPLPPPFKYAGGTEVLSEGCEGNLELNPEAMVFKCLGGAVEIPYSAVTLMQYRSDISRKVRRMKVKWKVRPAVVSPIFGAKRNRYFTVVYNASDQPRILVLRVPPQAMRPYLAELDLRCQRRVEVQNAEDY